jgi:2-hydroxy-6-oxonona-2,4-dienedioate hydrolase
MSIMWKNADARERMKDWHHRFRSQITSPLVSRMVATTLGETHVLVGGPEGAAPLVVLHGALASSAHLLLELQGLLSSYRVYAIDILGQSPMSADLRLSVSDDSAGEWLREVLDALGLAETALLGVSWGGFVAQRFAAIAPQRLRSLVLLVPAGLAASPAWRGFVEMGWPLTRYLLSPNDVSRQALLRALLTTVDDPLWAPYLAEAFLAANMRTMRVPKLSQPGEFAGLTCPVHVVAADRDSSFPGERVLERAKVLFPNLSSSTLLENTRHSPPTTPEFRAHFNAQLSRMLAS